MSTERRNDRGPSRFAPRVTLTLLAGFLVFVLSATLYVLPVLLQPAPPGAIPDWHKERVMARLDGKVPYFLFGSFLGVALLSIGVRIPWESRKAGH